MRSQQVGCANNSLDRPRFNFMHKGITVSMDRIQRCTQPFFYTIFRVEDDQALRHLSRVVHASTQRQASFRG